MMMMLIVTPRTLRPVSSAFRRGKCCPFWGCRLCSAFPCLLARDRGAEFFGAYFADFLGICRNFSDFGGKWFGRSRNFIGIPSIFMDQFLGTYFGELPDFLGICGNFSDSGLEDPELSQEFLAFLWNSARFHRNLWDFEQIWEGSGLDDPQIS